ncbi:MAG: DUF2157 domain-containing protein [Candidatus Accumulibacter sp.]|nr:DUF2157 domain-containing protein [Accumulibacter sp.]
MSAASRPEAQRRVDDIRVFEREWQRLVDEGVLQPDPAQEAALRSHHQTLLANYARAFDIDADPQAQRLSLGMRVASFLGALALAASVFFLFRRYWGSLPTAMQVGVLIAASLGSFAATIGLHGKDSSGYFTKLAAMLAFVCFVLNVALLGAIFNLTPSDNALLAWAALAFLLAYTCDLRLLLAAGILCVMAFIAARTGTWRGMYWLDFGERPENFLPAGVLFFLLPLLPPLAAHRPSREFAPIYRVFGLLALFLPMLVLANWGYGSYLDFDHRLIEGAYQIVGFLLAGMAIWLGAQRGWSELVNTGLTFFVIFLYTKLFDWWWEAMPKYLFFLLLGLIAVLILLILKRWRTAGGWLQENSR